MAHQALSVMALEQALQTVPNWQYAPTRGGVLQRTVKLQDFADAFACMTKLAFYAHANDHHPEWFNVYNRLEITLTTHDAGGVTALDIAFARYANTVFEQFNIQ